VIIFSVFKIDDGPVVFPSLEVFDGEMNQFGSTQSAAQKDAENGAVPLAAQCAAFTRIESIGL
jgi:hypothetical protein